MSEEWRDIPDLPGYQASSLGRVRSVDRVIVRGNGIRQPLRGTILSPSWATGYAQFIAMGQSIYVHNAVARAFLGIRPPGRYVLHGPAGASDNSVTNIRYGTPAENMLDTHRDGTNAMANRTHCRRRGHPLKAPNLKKLSSNRRQCLACHKATTWASATRKMRPVSDEEIDERATQYYAAIVAATHPEENP